MHKLFHGEHGKHKANVSDPTPAGTQKLPLQQTDASFMGGSVPSQQFQQGQQFQGGALPGQQFQQGQTMEQVTVLPTQVLPDQIIQPTQAQVREQVIQPVVQPIQPVVQPVVQPIIEKKLEAPVVQKAIFEQPIVRELPGQAQAAAQPAVPRVLQEERAAPLQEKITQKVIQPVVQPIVPIVQPVVQPIIEQKLEAPLVKQAIFEQPVVRETQMPVQQFVQQQAPKFHQQLLQEVRTFTANLTHGHGLSHGQQGLAQQPIGQQGFAQQPLGQQGLAQPLQPGMAQPGLSQQGLAQQTFGQQQPTLGQTQQPGWSSTSQDARLGHPKEGR